MHRSSEFENEQRFTANKRHRFAEIGHQLNRDGVEAFFSEAKFHAYLVQFWGSHFGLFWGFGLLLGYLTSSGTKSDVIFLLSDPDFS